MAIPTSFFIPIKLEERNLPTFLNYRYLTIPTKVHNGWLDEEGYDTYSFKVDPALTEHYSDPDISRILNAMNDPGIEPRVTIFPNNGTRVEIKEGTSKGHHWYKHYRIQLSLLLHEQFKQLFVSTFVHKAQGKELPGEHFTLRIDMAEKTATLVSLAVHTPENPFLVYARRAARYASFDRIFQAEQTEQANIRKINNFYEESSGWRPAGELDSMEEVKNVIYMLYDENSNSFYVGRADNLVWRLRQHQKGLSENEPIPDFTHFRYSTVSPKYSDYSYLLENAAIHDCAWIFDMPRTQRYKPCLQATVRGKSDLNNTKMVNAVDMQTRPRNKKK